jgi:hypothetical protein
MNIFCSAESTSWEIGTEDRPFCPPTFGNPLSLNHDIRATSLAKHMAHGQSGLATADNQGVDKLGPHGRLLFHRHAGERDSGGNVRRRTWACVDANENGLVRDWSKPGEALLEEFGFRRCHLFVHFLFLSRFDFGNR